MGDIKLVPVDGYLEARFGLQRVALLGAPAAQYVQIGSGGVSWGLHTTDFIDIEMR